MHAHSARSTIVLAVLGTLAASAMLAVVVAAPADTGDPESPRQAPTQLGGELVSTWPVTKQAWPFEPLDIGLDAGGRLYVADGASGKVLIYGRDGRLSGLMDGDTLDGSNAVRCAEVYPTPLALEIDRLRDVIHVMVMGNGMRHGFNEAGSNPGGRACGMSFSLADHAPVAMRGVLASERIDLALLPNGTVLDVTWSGGSYKLGTVAVPPPWARIGVWADGRRVVPRSEALELLNPDGDVQHRFALPGLDPIAPVIVPGGSLFVLARPMGTDLSAPVLLELDPPTGAERNRLGATTAWPHPPRSEWPWALAANDDMVAFTTVADGQFVVARFGHDGRPLGVVAGGPARQAPLPRTDLLDRHEQPAMDLDVATDGSIATLDRGSGEVALRGAGAEQASVRLMLNGQDLASAPDGSAIYAISGAGHVYALAPDGDLLWRRPLALDAGSRVSADADRVYVSVPTANRVLLLDAGTGAQVGERSSPADGPLWPADLAAPGDGSLVLLQPGGRGLLLLAADGSETARLGVALSGPIERIAARRVAGKTRIAALDGEGWVEIHEAGAGLLGRWPALDEKHALVSPSDLALDADGGVYVADRAARSIRRYAPVPDAALPTPSPTPEVRPTPLAPAAASPGTRWRTRRG